MSGTLSSSPDGFEGTLVVKLGGEVVGGPSLATIAEDLATLSGAGARIVVIHGGGPQATKLQEQLGLPVQKVAGRRVTDRETLEVMKMVVAGKLNVELCAALVAAGAQPVGLHGASGPVIVAARRPPRVYPGAGPDPVDLGFVGDVISVNRDLLNLLMRNSYLPVVACIGAGPNGQVYNINADTVANRLAVELGAESLLMVSDVPGVLRDVEDPSSRIQKLTRAEGHGLVESGVVSRGMIVKLEESFDALRDGVQRIHILGQLKPGDLAREAREPGSVGTVLLP
ncbi:acetylglutamate kinase [Chondromyces crocatus]|uniref:Acetylglutamate kinase n=1 Tax=Chondromyces crocatus TaxID=52 RepID=A0A0K1E8M2_CHOCO|nr:acetylglutamate kinase [Chondromyces crocatus]AKT37205.1 acetylglutamate kinase [Chondromyces crocatus]